MSDAHFGYAERMMKPTFRARPRVTRSLVVMLAGLPLALGGCSGSKASRDSSGAPADGIAVEVADESFLEAYASTYRFTLGRPKAIKVAPDGRTVLFLRSGSRSQVQELFELDVATGTERALLSSGTLLGGAAENLSDEEKARRERMRMASRGIASFTLSDDGRTILVPLSGRLFAYTRETGLARELESPANAGGAIDPQLSRDGTMVAAVRDGDVWVQPLAGGEPRRVTPGAQGTIGYGEAEFVAQEEMGRFHGFWWNSDGSKICYQGTDTAGMPMFHIADPVNPAAEPRAWPYPKAGSTNARVWLEVVPVTGGTPTRINWDRAAFPYVANVVWPKNGPLTVLVQNREQTKQRLLAVDAATGATTLLLEEADAAWLNIMESCPKWTEDGSAFVWLTESSGERTVELRRRDGSLIGPLTAPGSGVMDVLGLRSTMGAADGGSGGGAVWVTASNDATQSHVWKIPLTASGGSPVRLTTGRGVHSGSVGDDGTAVLSLANSDGTMAWAVAGVDGSPASSLTSKAETAPFVPRLELTQVPASKGVLCHAAIIRPQRFDPKTTYPVIVTAYTGPTAQTVRANPQQYILHQWMADQGFIVVSIDGRGTPGRGRAWERAWKELDSTGRGNLIDVALNDQSAAILELCRRYPEMDADRVGVSGWSFGGYFAAMAVMRRPDVYKAGVAGAPVCDWRDYDTHYTERYLGLPDANAAGYDASNVLTYCKDLSRPLLIIHGTADDNVYFMHSLKMTEALFREGKRFEFLPLAGFTHMVPDPVVTIRLQSRMMEFFARELR